MSATGNINTMESKMNNAGEVNELVEGFLQCSLPKEKWDHKAHITAVYYLYCVHGRLALPKMKNHIIKYNESAGTLNSDDSGYHETITVFWTAAIEQFAKTSGLTAFNEESLEKIYQSPLM